MASVCGDEMVEWENASAHEEKIYVAVRVRPLSDREISKNDLSDWECINNTTIIFKNTLQERSQLPSAYTFDRVFGVNSPTKHVYEEAAKKIALSVLSGINSTIFAYGQTGSGKTFTMCGITECAIADIYDYIHKHHERNFVLKFSAMEIYNEAVRDLLQSDGTPLRLLDDPERGTIVDKLTEVTLKDSHQLRELLSICEAQRRIGETNLNELSSRSHQILRLTVESEAVQYMGVPSSSTLTASVNFVDLAGSERASQTNSAGTRLKEGCHINRSLLSLGTVIRKLSKGRNAHIPYRDSKLTRILQNSLGGNARTAIICTMSPSHSHVEQSRNTLHFANCAKQVHTNAQVNVVMSEKALVKQLQKELARLESELKKIHSHSNPAPTALKEKELLIQKMDQQIKELINQRDLAQSRMENMLHHQTSRSWSHDGASWTDEYPASEASELMDPLRLDVVSQSGRYQPRIADQFPDNNEEQFLSGTMSPRICIDKYFGPDPCQGWEKMAQQNCTNSRNSLSRNSNSLSSVSSPRNLSSSPRHHLSTASSPRTRERLSGRSLASSDFIASDLSPKTDRTRNSVGRSLASSDFNASDLSPRTDRSRSSIGRSLASSDFNASDLSPRTDGSRHCIGRSLASSDLNASDLSPKTDRTRNCEAILASIMNASETPPILEKISGKKTLAALLRENSRRLSDAKIQSITDSLARQDSERFSDVKLHFISDSLSGEDSGRFSDATMQSVSDSLSRQDSGRLSDARRQSNNDALSRQNSSDVRKQSNSAVALTRQNSTRGKSMSIESHQPKTVKQQETNKVSSAAQGKAKKEKTAEESAGSKAKKEKAVEEGKSKKDRRSNGGEEIATPTKAKKEESDADWKVEFERRKREIIQLWDECHIPLVHRSYFYLLFKGDPSDAVYMEVEHRRLTFLKAGNKDAKDEVPSSPKALQREREMLSRRMLKKLTNKEREALFQKWGIEVKSKQRRLQLCRKLWTDTKDMDHVNESAAIVAKLAGLKEAGQAPKEMFGLTLVPKQTNSKSFSWRHPIPSII
ncbi:kinesin-like protein KIN-7E [Salvia miltiorrhiza]|uniref:kinesin-like protein KIN-7E n=1 Tax=Salvia miltiorrhiza TaxID=226208 RepID=UPI0025ABF051|nr:kinesin-like protein KIN-7E [Salvia miltiorrhiza]